MKVSSVVRVENLLIELDYNEVLAIRQCMDWVNIKDSTLHKLKNELSNYLETHDKDSKVKKA